MIHTKHQMNSYLCNEVHVGALSTGSYFCMPDDLQALYRAVERRLDGPQPQICCFNCLTGSHMGINSTIKVIPVDVSITITPHIAKKGGQK